MRRASFCVVAAMVAALAGCQQENSPAGVLSEPAPAAAGASGPPPPPPAIAANPPPQDAEASGAKRAAMIDPGVAGDIAMAAVPPDAKAFLNVSAEINKTLAALADGETANAAAPRLAGLAAQLEASFPSFKRFMATAPEEQVELVFRKQAADQLAAAGGGDRPDLTKLAQDPANRPFREAYIAYLHVLRDAGTSGTRRSAVRELAKLGE